MGIILERRVFASFKVEKKKLEKCVTRVMEDLLANWIRTGIEYETLLSDQISQVRLNVHNFWRIFWTV